MVETAESRIAETQGLSSKDRTLQAFRSMMLARTLEEKLASLYRGGKIQGGVYLGRGQEALSAALGHSLRDGDVFAPLIRDTGGRIAFGEDIKDALRTYMGSPLGPMRARDGNVHRGNPKAGYLPMMSHLGSMISVVNGVLFSHRMRGFLGTVGATTIGDGGTSTGAFHEALNQAAVEKLPLVLVIVNNRYAYSTPTSRQFACANLLDKAVGYGVEGRSLDGTSLEDCLEVVGNSVERAREGHGPQLVVADLLRLCGHGEHDDAHYVDPELKASPLGRDCMDVAEEAVVEKGWVDTATLEQWRDEMRTQVESAIATVQREPSPDPYHEEWNALSSRHLCEPYSESEG